MKQYMLRVGCFIGVVGALCLTGTPGAGSIQYEYDELRRLIRVRYDDGATIDYAYDASGNVVHVEKTAARTRPTKPSGGGSGGGGGSSESGPLLSVPPMVDLKEAFSDGVFAIINKTGRGELQWHIDAVYYPESTGWVHDLAPASGTLIGPNSVRVTFSVDRTGLAPGVHTAVIPVSSNGGTGNVSVRMEVPGAAPAPAPETGCSADADCDDGLFCNGVEVCSKGTCADGQPPCSADQVCMEEERVCWDIETLTAMSLRSVFGRPLVRARRCPWLVLTGPGTDQVDPDASTVQLTGPAADATGVAIDTGRSMIHALGFLLLPLCIETDATPGDWRLEISTPVTEGGVSRLEILEHSLQVR